VKILLNETGKSFVEGESMMNMSKMHIMQRKGTLIKFDTEKLKVFREKKMDKGSLRMRTQAHSQQKKRHLTLLQQTFMAVKENKIAEVLDYIENPINQIFSCMNSFYCAQLLF